MFPQQHNKLRAREAKQNNKGESPEQLSVGSEINVLVSDLVPFLLTHCSLPG